MADIGGEPSDGIDALVQGGPEAAAKAAAAAAPAAEEWAFSLFEPRATAWRLPYDAAIDKLTAELKAAKARDDLAAVAASQAELTLAPTPNPDPDP